MQNAGTIQTIQGTSGQKDEASPAMYRKFAFQASLCDADRPFMSSRDRFSNGQTVTASVTL